MALSGTITGSTNNQYIQPTITWSAVQSVEGNYSDITATLTYSRTNTGYTTSGTWSGSISIGGAEKRGTQYMEITYHSDTVAMTAKTRVKHSDDGTCKVTISATGGMSSGQTLKTTSISREETLNTIPRASKPALSRTSLTMGDTLRIQTNRANSSFFHDVWYEFGGQRGDASDFLDDDGTAGIYSWTDLTPPVELARRLPNATSGTCTVYLRTYADRTRKKQIGSDQSATFTLYVPALVVPTAEVALEIINDGAPLSDWGAALKGFSRLRYTVTAAGADGSSITGYRVTLAGQTFTARSGTTEVLNVSGDVTAQVTVTDSRGRTATASCAVTVQDYAPPSLSQSAVQRCTGDGSISDTGTYLRCLCTASCATVEGHNTVTCRVRYRPKGGGWSGYTALTNGAACVVGGTLSPQTTYEAELSAVDALGNVRSVTVIIPTAEVALHLREGGRGAAFGKYAEQNELLECSWNAQFDGDVAVDGTLTVNGETVEAVAARVIPEAIADYPVASAVSGSWRYRRWSSGMTEAWLDWYAEDSIAAASVTTWHVAVPDGIFSAPPDLVQVSIVSNTGNANFGQVTATVRTRAHRTATDIPVELCNAYSAAFSPAVSLYAVAYAAE